MRALVTATVIGLRFLAPSLGAQQVNSPEPVRLQPSPFISAIPPLWTIPDVKRIGIVMLSPPDSNRGEVVRLVVPVGDLVSRAAHAVVSAQHRRAERKAHDLVLRELQSFLAERPPQ